MPETLIQTRIMPPGCASGIVRRKRLLSLLADNIDKSLILICTSAGFGKTTLVQDFVNFSKCNCAWYCVTPDIVSFYSFFTYIIHSLKRLSKDFGENSLHLIDAIRKDTAALRNYKTAVNDITATFLNEFCSCFKDNVMLVLDDLHNIDSMEHGEWLNYLFDKLFDDLPQNLQIVVTTRETPEFNLSRLKAKRRVFQLRTPELVFNRDEITELLERVYKIDYSHDDIEILQSNISGWITGIHLILQAYGKEFSNIKFGDLLNYEDIFNYFANDIFEDLDEKTKQFLLGTALLQDFDQQVCNHLLKIDDGEKIINELLQKNIFIQRCVKHTSASESGTVYTYNYQELFKLFLLTKLYTLKSREEIKIQMKELFNYYLLRNEIIASVNYGLQAESYNEAIPVIKKNFRTLFEKGNFEILWKWISSIPDDIVNSDSYLLYYLGLLHLYLHSDPEKSLVKFNCALELAGKSDDTSLKIRCSISKTDASLLTGKFAGLRDELSNLLELVISPAQKARVLYALSRVLYREGYSKYSELIEMLTEAVRICNEENIQSLKPDVYRMLGNVYSDWGDLPKAIHFYEQSLTDDSDVFKIFRGMNNIIDEYCILGNYSKAKEYLDKTAALQVSFPSLLFKRFLLKGKGSFCFDCGDFEESIRNYRELNELEIKNNIRHYVSISYATIGEAYFYLKNYDAALKNFEIAMDYVEQDNDYHRLLILYLRKKLSLRTEPEPDTEQILLKTLEFHEENKILQQKVQIEFYLADFYIRASMPDSAAKYLKECLKVSSEKQYISFLQQEILNSRYVLDFTISHPELTAYKKFIRTLIEGVRERPHFSWISEQCRRSMTQQISELDDIRMTSFGKLEFRLRGELIPESVWVRKKSKHILAYLLAEPNTLLTKDIMIDKFFQDVPAENADAVYHNTLSNMRNALKIKYDFPDKSGLKTKGKSEAARWAPELLLYEDKTLHWNKDFYYWTDCAELEKLYNSAMSSEIKTNQKIIYCRQAIELYTGDFLPGYYDPWTEEKRQNYSNMYLKLCFELISALKDKRNYTDITKYAEQILKIDKLNEEAYISLIEAYSQLGEVNSAKEKFSLMLKVYDEELGEKPDKSALDRIKKILL